MTYRQIETTLGISGTSIHLILHKHLTVKKICSRWIAHNSSIAQKKSGVDWSKERLQNYDRGISKHVYDTMTGDGSWVYAYEPQSKQQSTVRMFQDAPNPKKVARARSTSKQMITCFFRKNWTCCNRTTRTTQNSQF